MLVCTALATCRERTRYDWCLAITLDLIGLAWVAMLIAWVAS